MSAICPNCDHPVKRSFFYLSRIKCTDCGKAIRATLISDVVTVLPAVVALIALLYVTWGTSSLWLSFPGSAAIGLFFRWLIFPYCTRFVLVKNRDCAEGTEGA